MAEVSFAIITVSDTASKDASKDRSGPRLVQCVRESFNNARIHAEIVPDEQQLITEKLKQQIDGAYAVILTTGGTGFAPRDVTPEATKPLLEKDCPQLAMAIALASLQKTPFAALSRGVCGISKKSLILNFPGSEKAVVECFNVVRDLLPHAIQLINDDLELVKSVHAAVQQQHGPAVGGGIDNIAPVRHICPHKTAIPGKTDDRNSPFPMLSVEEALFIIFQNVKEVNHPLLDEKSHINLPPFRASIKDGYAMKSTGFSGAKKVMGCIAAGDKINPHELQDDECFKINTGAALPKWADSVVQVEDTKLLKMKSNGIEEDLVDILVEPTAGLDIRPIGCDLPEHAALFPSPDYSPVILKSIFASIGRGSTMQMPLIGILSTGSELQNPYTGYLVEGKIYDSNTTMLAELITYFGFEVTTKVIVRDDFKSVEQAISELLEVVQFVICTGGVSMGDKDHIKPVLTKIGYDIKFGRVNMKPGKPMTYANRNNQHFFGLPGNPVSAFVCFHLFVLPALRRSVGWTSSNCGLARVQVTLDNSAIALDPRPEYVRATITSKAGRLFATVTGNQMSSRLQSIVGAGVLLQLPGRTESRPAVMAGETFTALVLRHDFIATYKD